MIEHLTLKDVGPARELTFDFAPRLNVLTGDNGLGKTFVLDVLWWVLTTTWAGEKAFPWRPPVPDWTGLGVLGNGGPEPELCPTITAAFPGPDETPLRIPSTWDLESQEWMRPLWHETRAKLRPRSLVVYARIDGSYAVWDSYYVKDSGAIADFAEAAVVLDNREVWDGKEVPDGDGPGGKRTVIQGLIADWVSWQQRARSDEFEALRRVLHALSSPDEPLTLGEPTRVHLRDRRDIPTLATPYGIVPVTLASAGVRRVLSLAYVLVWAIAEHRKAAAQIRKKPTQDVVLLIDEPELHLHPAWQRVFLPAVLRAVSMIAPNAAVQVFTSTHSPMVLASLETVFQEEIDDLFVLSRDGRAVRANELPFTKEGDVSNWLASEVFGKVGGRPREAKLAIEAAKDFMAGREAEAEYDLRALVKQLKELRESGLSSTSLLDERAPLVERIHDALAHTLSGQDEFWAQWSLVHRPGRGRSRRRDAAR